MRRFLKGDEGMLSAFELRNRRNPMEYAVINYMANTNGFTLMDTVSYDRKHNEKNGEENRDGSDYNYSWNCGAEGPTRKKKIMGLRKQLLKNAYLLLFLSQGLSVCQAFWGRLENLFVLESQIFPCKELCLLHPKIDELPADRFIEIRAAAEDKGAAGAL